MGLRERSENGLYIIYSHIKDDYVTIRYRKFLEIAEKYSEVFRKISEYDLCIIPIIS